MPVEMKGDIRKRVAGHIGATLGGFYLLHVPVKGKIAPTLFPTEYFVKQKEDEE
jgi:hypothetical protein